MLRYQRYYIKSVPNSRTSDRALHSQIVRFVPGNPHDAQWDGNGRLTQYLYDQNDRLVQVLYPSGKTVRYTYNGIGLRTSMTDSTGTTVWTYNGAYQLVSVHQPLAKKTVTYTYDSAGRRKTMSLDKQTWSYSYDGAGRLTNVQSSTGSGLWADFSYFDNDLLNEVKRGNGTRTVY